MFTYWRLDIRMSNVQSPIRNVLHVIGGPSVLGATDWAPVIEMKDESAADLNRPGIESGAQWSEVKCSTIVQAHCDY